MQKDEERWVYEYIQAAKNLEEQLAKKNFKLSDELSYYTDCYYPQDVVKELLLDENGTVNGVVPVLSELKKDYYYCEKINGEYNFVDVEEEHVKLLEQQLLNLNYWIPCSGEYNRLRFSCYEMGEYEERPLYFMDISLDAEAQNRLIWKFREWYGDTDQDSEQFGAEFYVIVSGILDGTLVLNPKYLQIEDVLDEYIEILPEKLRNIYVEGIHYTRKGCQPIPCLEGGKRAGFYAVLVKKAWLRKMKVFTPDSKWRSEDLPGFSGFYLAEGPSQACRYAVEEYGYPLKSLVAIVIGRVMSGDFSYLKLIKEM